MKIRIEPSLMDATTAATEHVINEGQSATVLESDGVYGWTTGLEWRTAKATEQRGIDPIVHIKPPGPRGRSKFPKHAGHRMVAS